MTAKVFLICRQTARRITYDFSPGRVKEVDKNKRFLDRALASGFLSDRLLISPVRYYYGT
jgi:hypothetical protein